jgi:hypothetical protein
MESALKEATYLVNNGLVWVHRIRKSGQSQSEIASIVAFTRNSKSVATISKVFTSPNWRRHGCAERLVRRVCKEYVLFLCVSQPNLIKISTACLRQRKAWYYTLLITILALRKSIAMSAL